MEKLRAYWKEQRGRLTTLAHDLKLHPANVNQWKQVPAIHVLKVEELTGISRHDLRPDVFGKPDA